MTFQTLVIAILFCNTVLLGLIYFGFGVKLNRAYELLELTKGYQQLAANQVRQTQTAVAQVPQVVKNAVAETAAPDSVVRRSGEIPIPITPR